MNSLFEDGNYGSRFELLKKFLSSPWKDNKHNESVCYFPLAKPSHNYFLCSSKICTRTHARTCTRTHTQHAGHILNSLSNE